MKAVERKLQVPKIQIPQMATPEVRAFASQMFDAHRTLVEQYNAQDDQFQSALRGGISTENNSLAKYDALKIQMPNDAPWINLTLLGTWAASGAGFNTPGYLMEPGGKASLRGRVGGSAPSYTLASGTIANLPTGYTDTANVIGFATEGGTGVVGIVQIQVGKVQACASAAGTPYFFLEPCTWTVPLAAAPHGFSIASPTQWPIIINHGFKKCLNLEVVSCRDSVNPNGMAGAPVPDWEDIGGGRLRLNGVWGLQWGKRYDLRVRMTAEE